MSYGTTFMANLTRDQLITLAYKDIGALADGEVLSASLLADGILKLNLIMREIDATGKWLWTEKSTSITLIANQWVYTTSGGFPSDLRQPDRITYRDDQADDAAEDVRCPRRRRHRAGGRGHDGHGGSL